ncbi:hypothetical protein MOJ76_07950 [Bacillus haynesii]|uniref:hypothetical protein n=1 Tax=Bacillus haynesii TaxID=1925021 RepID=UPI00227FA438|nr:hypothetical protein [Bacillus haynesii]MCY8008237.1 hypothetical protein [Bacillus haynesii]MCY8756350.1 hypothetical protein [Bacillus haynesii]MCY9276410.1 hypothetical protein [Bacillus haynesii]
MKKLIITTTVACMFGTCLAPFSSEAQAKTDSQIQLDTLTIEEEMEAQQITEDLAFIFGEASSVVDGKFVINKDMVAEKFGQSSVATVEAFVKLVNGEELTAEDLKGVPDPTANSSQFHTASWWGCLKEKIIDFTGLGFIGGGLEKMLKKKLWKKAATEIIKIVGKNAIRGGFLGLAGSLAWFSVRCIGK